jgi:hypothetical protein
MLPRMLSRLWRRRATEVVTFGRRLVSDFYVLLLGPLAQGGLIAANVSEPDPEVDGGRRKHREMAGISASPRHGPRRRQSAMS